MDQPPGAAPSVGLDASPTSDAPSQDELAALAVENLAAIVGVVSLPDFVLRWAAPGITDALGFRPEDVVGRPSDELWSEGSAAARDSLRQELARTGRASTRVEVRHADGSHRWMDAAVRAVGSYLVVQLDDAAERVEADEVRRTAVQRLLLYLESADDILIGLDSDGRFEIVPGQGATAPAGVLSLIGHRPWDVLGTSEAPWRSDSGSQQFDVRLQDGTSWRVRMKPTSGDPAWVQVGVMHDVTDDERAHRERQELARRFELLANSSANVFLCLDLAGSVLWTTGGLRPLLGHEESDLVGTTHLSLIHPSDVRLVDGAMSMLRHEQSTSYRARVRASDGMYVWVAAVVERMGTDELLARWRDCSAEVAVEEARGRSEQRFWSLAERGADGAYEADARGRIIWASDAMAGMLGVEASALVGSTLRRRVLVDDHGVLDDAARLVRAGSVADFDVRLTQGDGQQRWVGVRAAPTFSDDGAVAAQVATIIYTDHYHARIDAAVAESAAWRAIAGAGFACSAVVERTSTGWHVRAATETASHALGLDGLASGEVAPGFVDVVDRWVALPTSTDLGGAWLVRPEDGSPQPPERRQGVEVPRRP